MSNYKRLWNSLLIISSGMVTPITMAAKNSDDTKLVEVIVTAQKHEKDLQDTPMSLSVLQSYELEQLGIHSLDGLATGVVPSLRINPNGNTPSTLEVTIRGNGPTDVGQIAREGNVAIYHDSAYLGRAQGLSLALADIERIEVLRGPQGTLFGRNATSGAINILSKKPTGTFGIEQQFKLGSYDSQLSITRINLPAIADVSAKINYIREQRDGWVENTAPNASDFHAVEQSGAEFRLQWQPLDQLVIDYAYDYLSSENTQVYFTLYRDNIAAIGDEYGRQTKTRFPLLLEPTKVDVNGHQLDVDWSIDDHLRLKNITAYRKLSEDGNNNWGGVLYSNGLNLNEDIEQSQFSHEIQLLGDYNATDWVLGLYHFREKASQQIKYLFTLDPTGTITGTGIPYSTINPPTDFGLPATMVKVDAESSAAYGHLAWKPFGQNAKTTISAGLRYTQDKKRGARNQLQFFTVDEDSVDFSLALSYQWGDHLSTFVSWSSAFKSGGANARSASFSPYDKMTVDAWEVGLKSEWLGQRMRINATLFGTQFKDMQFDFVDPNNVLIIETLNARREVSVDGFELDLTAMLTDSLRLALHYTYLDGHMPLQPNPLADDALYPFEMHQTPEHAGSLTIDYDFAMFAFEGFHAHLNLTSTDRYAYSSVVNPRLDAHTLVNGRLSLPRYSLGTDKGSLVMSFWGTNLLDEEYVTLGYPIGVPPATVIQSFGDPRMIGVEVSLEFQ